MCTSRITHCTSLTVNIILYIDYPFLLFLKTNFEYDFHVEIQNIIILKLANPNKRGFTEVSTFKF